MVKISCLSLFWAAWPPFPKVPKKSYLLKFNIAAGQRWKSTKKPKTNQVALNTFIWRLNCFYHLLSQYGIHVYIRDGVKLLFSQIKVSIITWSTCWTNFDFLVKYQVGSSQDVDL